MVSKQLTNFVSNVHVLRCSILYKTMKKSVVRCNNDDDDDDDEGVIYNDDWLCSSNIENRV